MRGGDDGRDPARGNRSGHHQHPLHRFRHARGDPRARPEGAPPVHPRPRPRRTRCRGDPRQHARSRRAGAHPRRAHRRRSHRGGAYQPARDHADLGARLGPSAGAGHRLAGHPHRHRRGPPRRGTGGRGDPPPHRPSPHLLFLRAQARRPARCRSRASGAGSARGDPVRHDRFVARLEPHRRGGGGTARHRRHQRLAYPAHGAHRRNVGRGAARPLRHPPRHAARDRPLQRRSRPDPARRAGRGEALRLDRRPAGGPPRPGLHPARPRQGDPRHRHLPPPQHRRDARLLPSRASHHACLPARGRAARLCARRGDRGERRARPVAARPARPDRRRARDRGACRLRSRCGGGGDRARLFRALCAALERAGAGRGLRPHPGGRPRPSRPRRA